MASDVLAVIFVSALLISFACASVDTEKAFTQVEYDIINDTSSIPWQELRNEIHQGDAITYELGTPQYKILNADEPIEIITPDQPGYYESLKRYEEAAKQQVEENQSEATTTPPVDNKELTEVRKDKKENQLSIGEKKIRFIILNSKKKSKNSKIYLDVPKASQQDATPAETRKHNSERKTSQYVLNEAVPWGQQLSVASEAQAKERKKEDLIVLSKNLQGSKHLGSISLTSEGAVKLVEESSVIPITGSITNNNSSTQIDQKFVKELTTIKALTVRKVSPEESLQEPSVYDTPSTENTYAPLNHKPKELPSATGIKSPIYEAPPHIRDFEYLYRSALGIR